jgi:hypothetical protein
MIRFVVIRSVVIRFVVEPIAYHKFITRARRIHAWAGCDPPQGKHKKELLCSFLLGLEEPLSGIPTA